MTQFARRRREQPLASWRSFAALHRLAGGASQDREPKSITRTCLDSGGLKDHRKALVWSYFPCQVQHLLPRCAIQARHPSLVPLPAPPRKHPSEEEEPHQPRGGFGQEEALTGRSGRTALASAAPWPAPPSGRMAAAMLRGSRGCCAAPRPRRGIHC